MNVLKGSPSFGAL